MAILDKERLKLKKQGKPDIVTIEINSEIRTAFTLIDSMRKKLSLDWHTIHNNTQDTQMGWSNFGDVLDLTHII
jgi:hypothetical protein